MSNSDWHTPKYEFRDPVHGFVVLSEAERAIVNSQAFQRLRDIRQLAVAHFVYPGATHTRFEHSLGCLHVASIIFEHIERSQHDLLRSQTNDSHVAENGKILVRLAALLHDLGHPPFSHSGEHLFEDGHNHEQMSAQIIRSDQISRIINNYYAARGVTIDQAVAVAVGNGEAAVDDAGNSLNLRNPEWFGFLHEIIASEIGADRIDYLLRDAMHSGQCSGVFDHLKLIESMTLIEVPPPDSPDPGLLRLGVKEGGFLVAEQMIVARYIMYLTLYFHKTKRIYEKHLEKFIKSWLTVNYEGRFPTKSASEYLSISDSMIISDLLKASNGKGVPDLIRSAKPFAPTSDGHRSRRNHHRLAVELLHRDLPPSWPQSKSGFKKGVLDFQRKLLQKLGSEQNPDILVVDSMDHPATKIDRSGDEILVQGSRGIRSMVELSEVVSGLPRQIRRIRVYISPEFGQSESIVRERALSILEEMAPRPRVFWRPTMHAEHAKEEG